MKTYMRKRPEFQEIDNIHELCRLCLGKSEETVPIFTNDSEIVYNTLAQRIMKCVGLEISKEDSLPNIICLGCYKELERCNSFRKKCEITYQKLKSHVLAVKKKQYNNALSMKNDNCFQKCNSNKNLTQDGDDMKFAVALSEDRLPEVDVSSTDITTHINSRLPQEEKINLEPEVSNEDVQDGNSNRTELDISTFLTTMLLDMGILTHLENALVFTDQSVQTIDLELGDGTQIRLKLAEEDEQVVEKIFDSEPNANEIQPDVPEPKDVIIQNVTRDSTSRIVRRSKKDKKKNKSEPVCNICGKRFASRSTVLRHQRVHSGEKPYQCRDCGRCFSQREVMVRHRLVHSDERPFKCGMCAKSFTQRGALAAHVRAHEPPSTRALTLHRCAICSKVFLYASGLSRHMMIHSGRVYICGGCDKQFKDKSSLLRHLKNTSHAPKRPPPT